MTGKRNIALIGFMGTGKTSVGKELADRLNMTFLDMDEAIEKHEGRPVSDIFANEGELYFRKVERALVQELAAKTGLVIGTGGGVVLDPDNTADFECSGLVVCLQASPETILERVRHETHRPLLKGDMMGKITGILAKRQPIYDAVPNQVQTDGLSVAKVADEVLQLYWHTG